MNETVVDKSIAFFDFDGTITAKDTLFEFIKFSKGNTALIAGIIYNIPFLVAYKIGLFSNQKAKEKILRYFFGNMKEKEFENHCQLFVTEAVPNLLRAKALDEIQLLLKKKVEIVIVSASPENWIRPWTDNMGFGLIASKLENIDGRITGRLVGNNCHGQEKVIRIKEKFHLEDYQDIYAYGDSKSDEPMLALANKAFMRPFQ